MLIQAALAVIVGAGLYFRALRDKIKTFFSAVFHRKKDAVEPDDA